MEKKQSELRDEEKHFIMLFGVRDPAEPEVHGYLFVYAFHLKICVRGRLKEQHSHIALLLTQL